MAQNVSTEQVIKDHNDLPTDLSDFDMESTQNIISSNNKYSSSESLYHQSSLHNRVSNYGSIQGLPTANDETINIINSDKNKKIHRKCITTCAVVIGVFLISSAIGTGLLLKSYTPNQLITTSLKIGDEMSYNIYNPALIILDSSIASIVITLIDSHDDTVIVYTATTIPNKHMKYLPENTIPELSGPSRYNYNYFSADEPIYLQPQSILLYDLLIFISTHSNCPARLFLFTNEIEYMNFKNYKPYKGINTSCSLRHLMNDTINTIFTLNITEPSLYYVAIEIDNGVSVTSNVSVVSVQYNITGLENPSECSQPLSPNNPSCKWTLCSEFICNRPTTYALINPSSSVDVTYTTSNAKIHGNIAIMVFIFSLILFLISTLAFIILTLATIYYRSVIFTFVKRCPSATVT